MVPKSSSLYNRVSLHSPPPPPQPSYLKIRFIIWVRLYGIAMLQHKFASCQSPQPVKISKTLQVLSSGNVFSNLLCQETGDLHANANSHANQLLLPLIPPSLQPLGVGYSSATNSYAPGLLFFNLQTSRTFNIGLKSIITFHTARRKSTPIETARFGEIRCNPVTLIGGQSIWLGNPLRY